MFNRLGIFCVGFSVIALALASAQDVTLDSDTLSGLPSARLVRLFLADESLTSRGSREWTTHDLCGIGQRRRLEIGGWRHDFQADVRQATFALDWVGGD